MCNTTIQNPLLLNGHKFDLRLYVLVASVRPLEAFVYKEGFARLSTELFSLSPDDITNKFIHLTNSSIQKHNMSNMSSTNNSITNESQTESNGTKIPLTGDYGLWSRLEKQFLINNTISNKESIVTIIWRSICILIIKSLIAVDDKMTYQCNCFELFGYDILIDNNLHPWLLEVNASPSLARENQLDIRVKNALIEDTV